MRRGRLLKSGCLKSGCLMSLVLVFAAMAASAAHAGVRVTQQAGEIRVEARDASISEVLTALGASYELANHTTLASTPLNAIYSGSVGEIISHVLEGQDYTVRYSDGKLAIIIYGVSSKLSKSWVAPAPKVAPAAGAQSAIDPQRDGTTKASQPPPPSSAQSQSGTVSAMLAAAALNQMPNNGAASSSTADLSALTQSAVSSLQNLVASLESNVPKMCSNCAPSMDLPPPLPPDRQTR